jgi:lysophospholipase L1-like esterase
MILQTDADISTMTLTLYDDNTQAFLWSGTYTFTNPSTTGQWGVGSYFASSLKRIAFYQEIETLPTAFTLNANNIKVGIPITYTLTTSTPTDTILLSDNGAGGIFSTTNYTLNTDNNRTATGTYIPHKAGNITLTANFSSTGDKTVEIFASPYSTTMGFIGDSVTAGTSIQNYLSNLLGEGFLALNYGVPGSRAYGWATNNHGGSGIMTNALSAFLLSGVDIVHIMLGTNDAAGNVTSGVYKTNMQTIIDTLKSSGIKHIIISDIPYIATNDLNSGDVLTQIKDTSVRSYQQANAELITENSGFVLSGDVQAYQRFKNNQNQLANDYHPNSVGYEYLRNFWAQTISGMLYYQINPNYSFTGTNGATHTH